MSIVIPFLSCIKEWINNGDANGLVRYASPVHLQLTHWAIPNHASIFSSYQWVNSAIDDSDFIPNLTASLHLQVPRHLTTVKLMTEKQNNFVSLACDSVLRIGWRHQKWLTRVGKINFTNAGALQVACRELEARYDTFPKLPYVFGHRI